MYGYEGSLISFLTVPLYPKDIETIHELAAAEYSVIGFSKVPREQFRASADPLVRTMAERYKPYGSFSSEEIHRGTENKGAVLESLWAMAYLVQQDFTDRYEK